MRTEPTTIEEALKRVPAGDGWQLVYYPPGKNFPEGNFHFEIIRADKTKTPRVVPATSPFNPVEAINTAVEIAIGRE